MPTERHVSTYYVAAHWQVLSDCWLTFSWVINKWQLNVNWAYSMLAEYWLSDHWVPTVCLVVNGMQTECWLGANWVPDGQQHANCVPTECLLSANCVPTECLLSAKWVHSSLVRPIWADWGRHKANLVLTQGIVLAECKQCVLLSLTVYRITSWVSGGWLIANWVPTKFQLGGSWCLVFY